MTMPQFHFIPRHLPNRNAAPRPSVLIVEDEIALRDMLDLLVQMEGYPTLNARSGNDAIRILAAAAPQPRVLLLDLLMADGDGLSVLAWLREHPEVATLTRVLIVSAYIPKLPPWSQPLVAQIVQKPFDIDALLASIGQLAQLTA